jgi:hypothetical protein
MFLFESGLRSFAVQANTFIEDNFRRKMAEAVGIFSLPPELLVLITQYLGKRTNRLYCFLLIFPPVLLQELYAYQNSYYAESYG